MSKQKIDKLEKFFLQEINQLKDIIVMHNDDDNSYVLFGKYVIRLSKNGYYQVSTLTTDDFAEFNSLKNAVSWCTFEHAKKYREANRIKELDLRLCSIEVDLAIHKKMVKNSTNTDSKWTYIIKFQEDTIKKKLMLKELNTYINISKMLQSQRFSNSNTPRFSHLR